MVCSSVMADDATVELPLEFYFGRWADGYGGFYQATFTDERSAEGYADLYAAQPGWQLKLRDVNQYGVRDGSSDSISTPELNFTLRPSPRWQFGVIGVEYEDFEGEGLTNARWQGRAEARYSNTVTSTLGRHAALYSYYHGLLPAPGQLLLNGSVQLWKWESRLSSGSETDNSSTFNSYSVVADYGWSGRIHTSTMVSAGFERDEYYSSNSVMPDYRYANADTTKQLILQSRLSLTIQPASTPLFVRASVWGMWRDLESQSFSESVRNDTVLFTDNTIVESGLVLDNYDASIGLQYISEGTIEPRVLLDDYTGYYRRMLFAGQLSVGLDARYSEQKYRRQASFLMPGRKSFNLDGRAGYGFASKVEGQLFFDYAHQEYTRTSGAGPAVWGQDDEFKLGGGIRFRTYDYTPGAGPGWDRDSELDVFAGPVLRAGQVYGSVRVTGINLSDDRDEFLFEVGSDVGLGRGLELRGSGRYFLEEDDFENYEHQVSLTGRVMDKAELFGTVRHEKYTYMMFVCCPFYNVQESGEVTDYRLGVRLLL